MAEWYFRPKRPGELNREPVESEFFASNAISESGMALVREAIQNSLDARRPEEETVLVRIRLSGEGNAVPAERVAAYYERARGHLEADENGLRRDQLPARDQPCPYVVIEDFGTTGLEGDTSEPFRPPSDAENHFYHFFRAEGQSDKGASDRGVWGVGKCVFTRSSRINCMFGLTIRADDGRRLLMGKITLKSHWLDDQHCQEGFFGIPPEGDSGLVVPIEDGAVLDGFCDAFDLQRGTDTGLSVIIPWPEKDITQEQIVGAVLRDYFWPILAGQLEVWIETPDVKALLDSGSILDEARKMAEQLSDECIPLLELAQWAIALPAAHRTQINMPDPGHGWQWSGDLIPPEAIESLRKAFEGHQGIAVRVPVTVRPKDGPCKSSFLDAYIRREPTVERDRPAFIREGLIIPNVNSPRSRGVVGIVVVEDEPLAEFLRDAENPSHTEWQHNSSNFHGKYVSGRADIEFVKRSVQAIVRILTESDREEDVTLLLDIFSLPADEQGTPSREGTGGEGRDDTEGGPGPLPPSTPQPFRIRRIEGGFSIVSAGPNGPAPPKFLEVRVAYDTRRGNPLKRYNTFDFRLDQDPIEVDVEGLDIAEMQENHVRVAIQGQDFRLTATGFDPNRDLYIRVVGRQDDDAG